MSAALTGDDDADRLHVVTPPLDPLAAFAAAASRMTVRIKAATGEVALIQNLRSLPEFSVAVAHILSLAPEKILDAVDRTEKMLRKDICLIHLQETNRCLNSVSSQATKLGRIFIRVVQRDIFEYLLYRLTDNELILVITQRAQAVAEIAAAATTDQVDSSLSHCSQGSTTISSMPPELVVRTDEELSPIAASGSSVFYEPGALENDGAFDPLSFLVDADIMQIASWPKESLSCCPREDFVSHLSSSPQLQIICRDLFQYVELRKAGMTYFDAHVDMLAENLAEMEARHRYEKAMLARRTQMSAALNVPLEQVILNSDDRAKARNLGGATKCNKKQKRLYTTMRQELINILDLYAKVQGCFGKISCSSPHVTFLQEQA